MQRLLAGEGESVFVIIGEATTVTRHEDPQYISTDLGSIAFA